MARVILVTGSPGSGKSTVAHALAKKLGIYHVIGTDTIREILRACISKEKCPTLHNSAIMLSDLAPHGEDKMIWGFKKQALDVKPGIDAVVKRSIKEGKDIILDGIHLIPGIIEKPKDAQYIHIVLKVTDEERHIKQLTGQAESRSSYKIENLQKARAFQDYLLNMAKENNALVLERTTVEKDVQEILKYLGD